MVRKDGVSFIALILLFTGSKTFISKKEDRWERIISGALQKMLCIGVYHLYIVGDRLLF